jgi:Predicted membrane protein
LSEELPVLRASDTDREQAVARLRDASVEGRLTLEEFTERMTTAYDARTHAELDVLVHDLPAHAAPERQAPARRWVISFMGNASRRGRWRVGKRTFVISAMGNATVDLRDAILAGPEVSIHVLCSMGNMTIIVPEGVDVELSVIPFMGNRMDLTHSEFKQGAPLVRISGLVSMGNLFVRTAREPRRELPR